MTPMRGDDAKLDALLAAYRQACPDPEASANFMPMLWQRIDSRQRFTFSFGRMASALVTAALALSLALGIYLAMPSSSPSDPQSYVETLADSDPSNDYLEPVRYEVQ